MTSLFTRQLQYNFVFFKEFFFAPLSICGTCAGQAVSRQVVVLLIFCGAAFLPEIEGGFACADDVANPAVF